MDLQTFGIIFIVIVFSLLSILFVSKLPAGKTFDEMLAEKKQLAAKLDSLSSGKNEKNNQKKTNKKNVRKNKNVIHTHKNKESEPESVESTGSDTNSDNDIEFMETEAFAISANNAAKKTNKNATNIKKAKSNKLAGILVNKSEPILVKDGVSNGEINHFEEIHPKDAVEIHRAAHKEDLTESNKLKNVNKDQKKNKSAKLVENKVVPQQELVKSIHINPAPKSVEIVQPVSNISSSPQKLNDNIEIVAINNKESKIVKKKNSISKAKKPEVQLDDELNVKTLLRSIGNTALTHSEIQYLIDFLLNKKQDTITKDPTEWSEGRADIVQKMKKQLAEKEQQLKDEQDAIQALQQKLKTLRNEITSDKAQTSANIKAYIDDIKNKNLEIERLTNEAESLKEKFTAEKNSSITTLKHLHDDVLNKNQIISDLKLLVDESNMFNEEKQLEIDNLLCNKDEQKNLIELELRQCLQDLDSCKAENQKLRTDLKISEDELNRYKYDIEQFNLQIEQLKQQLSKAAANNHIEDLNKVEIRNLQNALDSKKTELKSLFDELNEYKIQNESLNSQILNFKQQINNNIVKNNEYSKEVAELNNILSNQKLNFSKCENKLMEYEKQIHEYKLRDEILNKEIEDQKDRNNDLRKKNWKLIEALQVAQTSSSKNNDISNMNVKEKDIKNVIEGEQQRTKDLLSRSLVDVLQLGDEDVPSEYNKWMEYILNHMKNQFNTIKTNNDIQSNQFLNNKCKTLPNNNVSSKSLMDNETNSLKIGVENHQNNHNSNNSFHQNDEENYHKNTNNIINNNVNNVDDIKSNSDSDLLFENAQLKSDVNNLKTIIADIEKVLRNVETKAQEQETHWRNIVDSKENEIMTLKSATSS